MRRTTPSEIWSPTGSDISRVRPSGSRMVLKAFILLRARQASRSAWAGLSASKPTRMVTLEGPSRHEMPKRRTLSVVPAGGPGSGSASACSGGGAVALFLLWSSVREVASPSSSPSELRGLHSRFCCCSLADLAPGPGTHILIRC